jgi:hypothetical protein
MKRFISLLIKVGLLAGIGMAFVMTNPKAEQHKKAIEAKQSYLEDRDVLGKTDNMMYRSNSGKENTGGLTYHNYMICSKVTDSKNEMASFGFFKRVFVTKNEL